MRQKTPEDGCCTYVDSTGKKCPEPYKARGFCAGHYRRAQLGRDMDPPIRSFRRADTEFRFWQFVERSDGCWLWRGCRESSGYGQLYDGRVGRARRAHVIMWELANSCPVPNGLVVRHSCDNPPCVRPEHLSLGTHADNVQDAVDRGRVARGSARSRLTDGMVLAMRAEYANGALQRDLAARYQIGQQAVSNIVNRKSWTHI